MRIILHESSLVPKLTTRAKGTLQTRSSWPLGLKPPKNIRKLPRVLQHSLNWHRIDLNGLLNTLLNLSNGPQQIIAFPERMQQKFRKRPFLLHLLAIPIPHPGWPFGQVGQCSCLNRWEIGINDPGMQSRRWGTKVSLKSAVRFEQGASVLVQFTVFHPQRF